MEFIVSFLLPHFLPITFGISIVTGGVVAGQTPGNNTPSSIPHHQSAFTSLSRRWTLSVHSPSSPARGGTHPGSVIIQGKSEGKNRDQYEPANGRRKRIAVSFPEMVAVSICLLPRGDRVTSPRCMAAEGDEKTPTR